MKFKIVIDKARDEEVTVYAHKRTPLVDAIEQLVFENGTELIGYIDREAVRFTLSEVYCFTVEAGKVCAITDGGRLQMRYRLYKLEEILPDNFIKINQSCIVNIKAIERFSASISGALQVKLKNGYTDYVSRRNLKFVKERLGF